MSLAPLGLVSADTSYRVTFTTFALRVSFFEAISLDRLIRGGGRQAMILARRRGRAREFSRAGGAARREGLRGRAGRGDLLGMALKDVNTRPSYSNPESSTFTTSVCPL